MEVYEIYTKCVNIELDANFDFFYDVDAYTRRDAKPDFTRNIEEINKMLWLFTTRVSSFQILNSKHVRVLLVPEK